MTGLTGGRLAGFDLWQGSCVRLWPRTLNVLQPAVVQAAPVIFYGTLLPDERTRGVCFPDWNCIKEKVRRKENEPGCHWSENCSMAAWPKLMKGLISFDNTQQWAMTPTPPTPPCVCALFHLQLFSLKHGLICSTASATLLCLPPLYAQQPAANRLCVPR